MLLSIDQALKMTGYSVFDNKEFVECNHFSVPPKEGELPQRLDLILLHLEEICSRYPIDRLALEDTQQQYNVETFRKLNYLEGIIEYWACFSDLKYVIMSPSHWRKVISDNYGVKFGRKRADQKKASRDFAIQQTGNNDITEDEADSYCIGVAAIINNEFDNKYIEMAF